MKAKERSGHTPVGEQWKPPMEVCGIWDGSCKELGMYMHMEKRNNISGERTRRWKSESHVQERGQCQWSASVMHVRNWWEMNQERWASTTKKAPVCFLTQTPKDSHSSRFGPWTSSLSLWSSLVISFTPISTWVALKSNPDQPLVIVSHLQLPADLFHLDTLPASQMFLTPKSIFLSSHPPLLTALNLRDDTATVDTIQVVFPGPLIWAELWESKMETF